MFDIGSWSKSLSFGVRCFTFLGCIWQIEITFGVASASWGNMRMLRAHMWFFNDIWIQYGSNHWRFGFWQNCRGNSVRPFQVAGGLMWFAPFSGLHVAGVVPPWLSSADSKTPTTNCTSMFRKWNPTIARKHLSNQTLTQTWTWKRTPNSEPSTSSWC